MEKKRLEIAIGTSDFKDFRETKNAYYFDKSLFIKDVLDCKDEVILITRPRRFGKTLNMSMLYYYLSIDENCKEIFQGLKIMDEKDALKYLNKVPVIFLSFNGFEINNYEDFVETLKEYIFLLYNKFYYLKDSRKLTEPEKQEMNNYLFKKVTASDLKTSLLKLSMYLEKHHGIKPYILIDEYDVPLQKAFLANDEVLYNQVLNLLKSFYGNAFKDNKYVDKTILTGVSRIVKEGIFTGVNNFRVYTVLKSSEFSDDFGFLEDEVEDALKYFHLTEEKEKVKEMYDGYRMGNTSPIYNPWSITNYLKDKELIPYWVNTSSNDIIQKIVEKNNFMEIKEKLTKLLNDETIEVKIDDEVSIHNIDEDIENIWSLLLGSGYLKVVDTVDLYEKKYHVKIPNKEIMFVFRDVVNRWYNKNLNGNDTLELLMDLMHLDMESFERKFKELVITSFSYFDVPNEEKKAESFYHAFTLGLMIHLKGKYYIHSNKESGYGRYDIELEAMEKDSPSFLFEFKLKGDKSIKEVIEEAKKQMNEKAYITNLKEKKITNIHQLIFVFHGKDVTIKEV